MNLGYITGYLLKSLFQTLKILTKSSLNIAKNGVLMGLEKPVNHQNKIEKVGSYALMYALLSPNYALKGINKLMGNFKSEYRNNNLNESKPEVKREVKEEQLKPKDFGFDRVDSKAYTLESLKAKSEELKVKSNFKINNNKSKSSDLEIK